MERLNYKRNAINRWGRAVTRAGPAVKEVHLTQGPGKWIKNPLASAGDAGDPVGFDPWVEKIPLEKEMATHSGILAWRIPWTEEPGQPLKHSGTWHSTVDWGPPGVEAAGGAGSRK